ncbi:MAG: hypothetical protein J2P55_04450 [Rhizobiales bacterium]|nr:hypothetical protein [Hyphomicrobiales bacterium]
MTDIPFPLLSTPGQRPQVAGGRVINCYPEPLAATAGKPNAYWRVAGASQWGTAPSGNYRGGVVVAGTFYAVFGTTVYKFTSLGGPGVALPGSIPGTSFCWLAANQNSPPDIVCVSPGIGAFIIVDPTGVANYPGGVVGTPNCVAFMSGMFIFTYGNGLTQASNVNSTTIGSLSNAAAQSKPDALYRPIPLTNGQLLLAGANTIEVWGAPINSQGYPFSYISTIYRGIAGPQAIAGAEDGWGKGIFLVGDDNKVSTLTTYTPTPISVPDLDQLIEKEPDKTKIIVGVYVARGHGMVVVQGPNWCWEYDTTLQVWHERQSYLQNYWRGYQPIFVFNNWLCGDSKASWLLKLDGTVRTEGGQLDVQTLSVSGSPTSGSFILSLGGNRSTAIAYNATAAQVQTALSTIANATCSGGPLPGTPVTITFNKPGAQSTFVVAANGLTAGSSPAIAHTTTGIAADPLRMRIETGPMGAFPRSVRVNSVELYMTKGASDATGHDPDETNAMVEISMSRNGGQSFGNPRQVAIGPQSITTRRARASIWGQAEIQGVRWRFDESAGLNFGFMGADMLSDVLR